MKLHTPHLTLVLESLDEVRKRIEGLSDADRAQLSPEWLRLLAAAACPNPWIVGFRMVCRDNDAVVGQCGFKGPPSADGVVEIAYFVQPESGGRGFATEAAEALVSYASGRNGVRTVRAHTLPEMNASTRVLSKCGFGRVGEVVDPDDGPVWRWERHCQDAGGTPAAPAPS